LLFAVSKELVLSVSDAKAALLSEGGFRRGGTSCECGTESIEFKLTEFVCAQIAAAMNKRMERTLMA